MVDEQDFLQALATVESHPDYQVFTRFKPREVYSVIRTPSTPTFRALFLDLETTSLETATCEVIEFAGAVFTFGADGRVFEVVDTYNALQQPSAPLDPIIVDVTGLTDEELAGQSISVPRVAELVSGVDLVIAYNAEFDRPIAERAFPGLFEAKPWACAYKQIQWAKYGAIGAKLQNVAMAARIFYDAHRALVDCQVGIHLLASLMRDEFVEGTAKPEHNYNGDVRVLTPMAELLETTKTGAWRILAHGAAFEWKDRMKARGYQWRGQVPWFIDVGSRDAALVELRWLSENAGGQPTFTRIKAVDRYSIRASTQ